MVISKEPVKPEDLIDGKRYRVGAVIGTYNKKENAFNLGNCFFYYGHMYRVYELLDGPEEVNNNG